LSLLDIAIEAVESGVVPDLFVRAEIRRLCNERARAFASLSDQAREETLAAFVRTMRDAPIAPLSEKANEQHYELPPEFFSAILGPRHKYSCCLFPDASTTLAEAENFALTATCERAELKDGQNILELGCGWGSLSLWMAERYPHSRITAVSNSVPQREFIESEARARKLSNLRVITRDMNAFTTEFRVTEEDAFDRVVSVEMFEHMRNYGRIFESIGRWLRPDGKCFIHIFCNRQMVYPFETEGATNWMGRYFFTGGIMPSHDLPQRFNGHLKVASQWDWNGQHYQRTSEAWLKNMDAHRGIILPILKATYGEAYAVRWLHRWRVFFIAVAELFGCNGGEEWFVSHYLLEHVH
jgi:cyclopropane-fatty-acyl-phospholipid synthase